jgi:hypothetical protein
MKLPRVCASFLCKPKGTNQDSEAGVLLLHFRISSVINFSFHKFSENRNVAKVIQKERD